MRNRRLLGITALALAGLGASPPPRDTMVLGVATHFDQGWPLTLLDRAAAVHAASLRDDVPWGKGEPRPGTYDFSDARLGFARRTCAAGGDVLLVIDPRNDAYNGGGTARTPAAQRAFGTYLAKLLDQLPEHCVAGIEVGNEINADAGMTLPPGTDRARIYVALLHAVRDAIHGRHPGVAIVGGSTNVIGTGFIESLAAAGGLEAMDAVAVHPYRGFAEGVDIEIDRLKAAMARHGPAKPIWATEFGNYFPSADEAPALLVKMVAMLGAAGVSRAYWYALADEPYFANMGLYDGRSSAKPAAEAYRLAVDQILSGGAPVRLDAGDRRTFVYRLASGGYLLWGDPRPLTVTGSRAIRDARGRLTVPPATLSDDPVLLPPGALYVLGDSPVVADSLPEFARAPWSYRAMPAGRPAVALAMRDWQWTSFYGAAGLDPLGINAASLAPAGNGAGPVRAVVRYTAPRAQRVEIAACFTKKKAGDGVDLTILRGGAPVYSGVVVERTLVTGLVLDLAAGEPLDVAIGPNHEAGDDAATYRIRLIRPGSGVAPACMA